MAGSFNGDRYNYVFQINEHTVQFNWYEMTPNISMVVRSGMGWWAAVQPQLINFVIQAIYDVLPSLYKLHTKGNSETPRVLPQHWWHDQMLKAEAECIKMVPHPPPTEEAYFCLMSRPNTRPGCQQASSLQRKTGTDSWQESQVKSLPLRPDTVLMSEVGDQVWVGFNQ